MSSHSKIPCSLPFAQYQSYEDEILKAIKEVLQKGHYILGSQVKLFEEEFADYHGASYAIGVGSGTDALALTLKAYDIGPGDQVITVSHTALATVSAIVMSGATPVLVDIEPGTYTLDPTKLAAALTKNTKAIIPVHLYGQPCDMESIMTFAKNHNLKVIEDCAQAHGAIHEGRKVGTIGNAGCFSFYPTKNLGAIGDGGAIITNDSYLCERLRRMRQYGWDEKRVSVEPGVVSRLDEVQAAILRVKLKYLDQDNAKRINLAAQYSHQLQDLNLQTPQVRKGCQHVYHLYVISGKNRDQLKQYLADQGVETGIHYLVPAHLHPGYKNKISISMEGLERTETLVNCILSLPMYPELVREDVGKVVNALQKYYQ